MKRCGMCDKQKDETEFNKNQQRCRECQSAYDKTYCQTHRDKKSLASRMHRAKHPQAKDEKSAYQSAYRKAHKDKVNEWTARRRADKEHRTLKSVDPKEIKKFYREAERLTRETGIRYSVDHIIPIHGKLVSGLHVPWNLRVITLIENIKKWNRV